mmetsp:Transcript_29285/g.45516  ORF Transcript_29285/g.45516 Transcript_29285/m.45516 type:complete len:80 (+) Transcript_29285:96-335(+)
METTEFKNLCIQYDLGNRYDQFVELGVRTMNMLRSMNNDDMMMLSNTLQLTEFEYFLLSCMMDELREDALSEQMKRMKM